MALTATNLNSPGTTYIQTYADLMNISPVIFSFKITAIAANGDSFTTPVWSLETKCGPMSANAETMKIVLGSGGDT